jgi:hypothetical protein
MWKSAGLAALALALAAAAPAHAAEEMATFKVTNTSARIAICTVVVDSHSDTYLKIRPGKSHTGAYAPKRQVQLVCDRAAKLFWPIKLGASYRLVDGERRLELVEDAGG